MDHIRNFSIIAHIDHGKSTLADRILEVTGAVSERDHMPQLLDSMELERERGITIKAQAVRVGYEAGDGVAELLEAVVAQVPSPQGDLDASPRALIFDSEFDQYRGVIAYVRVVDGELRKREAIVAMQAGTEAEIDDIGFFTPQMLSLIHI